MGIDLLVLAASLDKLVAFLLGTVMGIGVQVLVVGSVLLLTTFVSRILAGLGVS